MLALEPSKQITMSSVELVSYINSERKDGESELRHDNFMAKVAQVLGELGALNFKGTYFDAQNKERPCYKLPKREACLMAMSYSYELQAKVFDKMTELEAAQSPKIPATYIAALEALVASEKARIEAVETKSQIGARREATAMNTASLAVKKAAKLEIELDRSKEYATIKRMELNHHGVQFKWRLLKEAATNLNMPAIDVFDANYGTVKAYHASVWYEAYALGFE